MTIEALHQKFIHELPGEAAQDRMSPRPKHVEGEEGIHQGHPIHSAVMLLLVPYQSVWQIPFIKRTNVGKYHGGQWPYPVVKANRKTGTA